MVLKINALGLENSLRKKTDGISYFGFQEDISEVFISFYIYFFLFIKI